MDWTKEADRLLINNWREGKSMTQVAEALAELVGVEVSRSAVAGRARRLREMGYNLEARPMPVAFRNGHDQFLPPPPTIHPIMMPPAPIATDDSGVDYSRLGPRACKAILDSRGEDGLHKCCGKRQRPGSVYCEGHYARYYTGIHRR